MAPSSRRRRPIPLLILAAFVLASSIRPAIAQTPTPPRPLSDLVVRPRALHADVVRSAPALDKALIRAWRVRPVPSVRPLASPAPAAPDHMALGTRFVVGEAGATSAWLEFAIPAAGDCVFEARWSGDTTRCRMTVRDPWGNELHSSGASPLRLELDVAPAHARADSVWRVTIAPADTLGTAEGELIATLPRPATAPRASDGAGGATCTLARTILDDGRVRITYPDSTVVTYTPGGGFEVTTPQGTTSRALCMEVPAMAPPPPPGDPQIDAWLAATEAELLGKMRGLLADEATVQRYLAYEATVAPTVYERIRRRIDVLGLLVQTH